MTITFSIQQCNDLELHPTFLELDCHVVSLESVVQLFSDDCSFEIGDQISIYDLKKKTKNVRLTDRNDRMTIRHQTHVVYIA